MLSDRGRAGVRVCDARPSGASPVASVTHRAPRLGPRDRCAGDALVAGRPPAESGVVCDRLLLGDSPGTGGGREVWPPPTFETSNLYRPRRPIFTWQVVKAKYIRRELPSATSPTRERHPANPNGASEQHASLSARYVVTVRVPALTVATIRTPEPLADVDTPGPGIRGSPSNFFDRGRPLSVRSPCSRRPRADDACPVPSGRRVPAVHLPGTAAGTA